MDAPCEKILRINELSDLVNQSGIENISISSIGYSGSTKQGAIYIRDSDWRSSMRLAVYDVSDDYVVSNIMLRLNDARNAEYVEGLASLKGIFERRNIPFTCAFDIGKARSEALNYAMRLYDASMKL